MLETGKKDLRRAMLVRREAFDGAPRERAEEQILLNALKALDSCGKRPQTVGLYVPFKGEVDITPLARPLMEAGVAIALPETVEKHQPLRFRQWDGGLLTRSDIWGIPVPDGPVCMPDLAFVPLLAFSRDGHRLGYGGGHYDRTLKASPDMFAIGVAFSFQEADILHHQDHDHPLNMVVTDGDVILCAQ